MAVKENANNYRQSDKNKSPMKWGFYFITDSNIFDTMFSTSFSLLLEIIHCLESNDNLPN